jgi:hypothetical protein
LSTIVSPVSRSRPSTFNLSLQGQREQSEGKVKNMYRKVKKNIRKTLSPASVDKSVNKISLPSKYRAFHYLQHVFA